MEKKTENKDSILAKLKKTAETEKIPFNTVLTQFFFDEFISLLGKSLYKDKFILKGGVLMSFLFGINNRATVDIDFLASGFNMDGDSVKSTIEKIIAPTNQKDQKSLVWFETGKTEPIRDEDEYGGFRVHIIGHMANVRLPFGVDIATGDPVTPGIKEIPYQTVTDETILIYAYPLETILAEKVQTLIARQENNGRSKDFYDIHMLMKFKKKQIDPELVKTAASKTFAYRQTKTDKANALEIVDSLEKNALCRARWNTFVKKNPYAKGIEFNEVLSSCKQAIQLIFV